MPNLVERIKRSWNAFLGREENRIFDDYGYGSSYRPDRMRFALTNARSIVSYIYNRIAVDCAQIHILHVRLDEEHERYKETIKSPLNSCLTLSANTDQTGRALIQDVVQSMFDDGCVAIVPVDTDVNPINTESYNIFSLRTGKIVEWFPDSINVEVYNEKIGQKKTINLPKRIVAIIENPFYAIMNEPNSTLQRLIRTMNQLDRANEQNSSGKLDMMIQLPYSLQSKAALERASSRRKDIETQLTNSPLGIAYIDGTERVIQLNRPLENNLWTQYNELIGKLYNQLGLTEAIINGTADEKTFLNYYNHTIEPILSAITIEMERKWLSKTARSQLQAIRFFKDPFTLVPVDNIAEIADKFTRNEILTSNEIRTIIGMKPASDPKADKLINSNINQSKEEEEQPAEGVETNKTPQFQNEQEPLN